MKLQSPRFNFPVKNKAPIRGIKYYKETQGRNRACILLNRFIYLTSPNIIWIGSKRDKRISTF